LEVKYAVEKLFKVKVLRVNTMRVRGKARRQRTWQYGQTPSWKKAIVTLKQGDKIEIV
jgi:large subunit ribosomal protein L23